MSRKRSTWNKKADPYTMHQQRDLPPAEKYLIGDPSAFGEDVHQPLPDDPALGRNEIGQPNMPASNMNHKDVDQWNSAGPYDNSGTFDAADRDRKETPDVPVDQMNDRKISHLDKYAALERKSYHCSRIAYALLPNASDETLENQAFELMSLPDQFVLAASLRLAEEEEKEEKKDEEKKDEDKGDKKEEKKDEGEKEDKDEDDKDDKKKEASGISDSEVAAMLAEMEAEEAGMHEESMMDEESYTMGEMHEEGEMDIEMADDVDSMLDNMSGMDMGMETSLQDTDFNIGMNPMMDTVAADVIAGDETLQNLFNDTIPEGARQPVAPTQSGAPKTAGKKGVSTLGGRVKGAATAEEDLDLSKLWKSDPDVSGSF